MVIRDNVVAGIVNEISAAPAPLANLGRPHSITSSARWRNDSIDMRYRPKEAHGDYKIR
jgi:hypothetical protein